jgi:hypothetical protein
MSITMVPYYTTNNELLKQHVKWILNTKEDNNMIYININYSGKRDHKWIQL